MAKTIDSYVLTGGATVLPPKGVPLEPELPAWSSCESQDVSAEISVPQTSGIQPPGDPLLGWIIGLFVGMLLSWLTGRFGRR